jgi:hypothetical protein
MADPICDDTPVASCAHPDLPPLMAAELEARYQAFLDRGDIATASVLGRMAASTGPAIVRELKRRVDRGDDYLHPTVLVGLWRDRDTRPKLKRLLCEGLKIQQVNLTWRDVRAWLRFVADHERQYREFLMATLLANLAEQATRLDEGTIAQLERRQRAFAKERGAAELLRKAGYPDQAAVHTQLALFHLWRAQKLAREWTPDAEALIRGVRGALSWQIGFLGYGIAGKLVGAALTRRITRWQARYLIESSSGNPAISRR